MKTLLLHNRIDDRVYLPTKKPSMVEVELKKGRLMILVPS
jgi:hypothetical protein